jgi:hypothetical protein
VEVVVKSKQPNHCVKFKRKKCCRRKSATQ